MSGYRSSGYDIAITFIIIIYSADTFKLHICMVYQNTKIGVLKIDKTHHIFSFAIYLKRNEIATVSTPRSSELVRHKIGFRLHSLT